MLVPVQGAFPGGSLVVQETQAWSLGRKVSLEKEMATESSVFAWEIPWTEAPGGLQSMGRQRSQTWFPD